MGRGAEPITVAAVEQQNTVELGMGALVTFETPEGRRAFFLPAADCAEVGAALTRIGGVAHIPGLFLPPHRQ